MTQQHLIAPSPGLVQQWCDIALAASGMFEGIMQFATRAAQWGADQELEACCEWLNGGSKIDYDTAALLRAHRRLVVTFNN
jgi:hypothetical protein